MKAKELRIGNWGKAKNCDGTLRDTKVTHIGKIYAKSGEWAIAEPIPLTEDWFIKEGGQLKISIDECCSIIWDGKVAILIHDYSGDELLVIEYVHSLQNLYFALTGTELELI